ncbi:pseudouridine synthase [Thermatribacter velox]|jgi:pseudouridine synthase|uniref:Pseudouridine synthase n=1 Tax=Thermatribacter velox TaxID=3039681 RepID=A0ABZ2Y8I2_9BACT|nr:rRNA synthase [Candidatus Atribacteria bacterium]
MEERLNKFLAKAGVAARRKCDRLIQEGRVMVNGEVVLSPGYRVTEKDRVTVDGKLVECTGKQHVYLQLYKPRGYLTTLSDPLGRKTVADLLRDVPDRVFPVGRLDQDSEGLLLFTNDGQLAYVLAHPCFEVEKKYLVYASGKVTPQELDTLKRGIRFNDQDYRIREGLVIESNASLSLVEVILTEGKKHEVKILFEEIGHSVLRLIRIKMGPVVLDSRLLPGKWRYLTSQEVEALQDLKTSLLRGKTSEKT